MWPHHGVIQDSVLVLTDILVMPKTTIGGGDEEMRGSVSAKSIESNLDQKGRGTACP